LELAVEMVLDDSLVAAGDEDEVLDAGLARLVDHMLNQRPVDHRQHLLRHGLGGREEPGAQPGDRENGFADRFHELVGIVVVTLAASTCLGIAEVCGGNGRWNAGGKAIKSFLAGRRPGSVKRPATIRVPHNLTRNNRVETKRHGKICPTDGPPERGGFGRHRLGSPGAGPGAGHSHAVQCAGRERRGRARADGGRPGLERRIRRLKSPADDGAGDPRRCGQFPQLPRPTLAAGRAPRRAGVARAVFQANVAGLTHDLRIMDLLDAQPEFTKSFWDYLDILVNEDRIQNGRAILAQHRATFDAVEKAYGVDRHFIAAIWGVESNYGTQIGERSVIRSTATLACVGRRQDYFLEEFLTALEILARGDVKADHLKGSWAGAFGPTQFMPTSFKRYAIDFDGDGRRDVVDSVPDVVASTANNLKKDGWVTGQTWGYEIVVPNGFNYLLADRSRVMSVREWERLGIRRAGGKAFPRADDRAYLLVPAGAQGPGFLMLQNFRVIMKYNPAEAYALAIGHLADRA